MVKVGFILEGESDMLLFQSGTCNKFLKSLNVNRINVIDAGGCGNLLPHNIEAYIQRLENQGAEKIVIITDLDTVECITKRKEQIQARPEDTLIIAVKEIESWYLADSVTMKRLLRIQHFNIEFPERELEPFEKINKLLVEHTGNGIGKSKSAKIKLAQRMLDFGFSFERCSQHPNCHSASYFVDKLIRIGQSN